jgi:hypothetical protein
MIINASAGVLTAIVVAIFAIVKFTEGAWIVVVLFAVLVPALIRLNHEYRMESEVLATISGHQPPPAPNYARQTVLVFVDSFDLATLAALRYARSLRPTSLRAVHFVIDNVRADKLRDEWTRANRGVVLDFIDCPDRRLTHCAAELVGREVEDPSTHVTVILPRRSYSALLGRLLHDRTADKIAAVVSRIPRSAATIVPYDVQSRVRMVQERQAAKAAQAEGQPPADGSGGRAAAGAAPGKGTGQEIPPNQEMRDVRKLRDLVKGRDRNDGAPTADGVATYGRPVPPADVKPIGSLTAPGKATVEGRVRALEIRPVEQNSVLALEVADSTGDLTALFYGRSHIAGVICGSLVRLRGPVGLKDGHPVMINPAYELVATGADQ